MTKCPICGCAADLYSCGYGVKPSPDTGTPLWTCGAPLDLLLARQYPTKTVSSAAAFAEGLADLAKLKGN